MACQVVRKQGRNDIKEPATLRTKFRALGEVNFVVLITTTDRHRNCTAIPALLKL